MSRDRGERRRSVEPRDGEDEVIVGRDSGETEIGSGRDVVDEMAQGVRMAAEVHQGQMCAEVHVDPPYASDAGVTVDGRSHATRAAHNAATATRRRASRVGPLRVDHRDCYGRSGHADEERNLLARRRAATTRPRTASVVWCWTSNRRGTKTNPLPVPPMAPTATIIANEGSKAMLPSETPIAAMPHTTAPGAVRTVRSVRQRSRRSPRRLPDRREQPVPDRTRVELVRERRVDDERSAEHANAHALDAQTTSNNGLPAIA